MTEAETALLQRIESFSFDPPSASYTVAHRLARENGWSPEFATRAIDEYRRFAFLAIVAGHPVSPSPAVDDVWHLHLIYTRSYWQAFCQDTLGRPLHHEPSTGSGSEHQKFETWYDNTLASYRRYFGEPPDDLWPQGAAKAASSEHCRRVDAAQHWIIPHHRLHAAARVAAGAVTLAAMAMLMSGCQTEPVAQLNPLDFRGPRFLAFYGIAFTSACIWGLLIRLGSRDASQSLPRIQTSLDPFELAFLNGGRTMAAQAVVASLCFRGLLAPIGRGTVRADKTAGADPAYPLHPFEQDALETVRERGTTRITVLPRALAQPIRRIDDKLQSAGLIVTDTKALTVRAWSLPPVLAVIALGILKIFIGLSRDRPVLFLVAACIASLPLAIALFARRPHRTRQGDHALRQLRSKHRPAKSNPTWVGENFAQAFALFGVTALAGSEWRKIRDAIQNPFNVDAGGGGSSSCSGGGSSCGGGGGGCGGGGCGGCGG